MKMKLYLALVFAIICFAAPAMVQADEGAPDSLYFVASELDATGNDSILTLQLWAFTDGDVLGGIQMGFAWETDNVELLTAVAEQPAKSAWNQFFFVEGNVQTDMTIANANNRALFSGFGIFTANLQPMPTPQLIASYTFRVSNWDVNSQIVFDQSAWDDGTEFLFINAAFQSYTPVWKPVGEKLIINDVNHVQCDAPIITCVQPAPMTVCVIEEICFDLPISGADNVTITGLVTNPTWANGQLCFTPSVMGDIAITVTASVDCGEQTSCTLNFNFTAGEAPKITCPSVPIPVSICGPQQVCVPLDITGSTNVTTSIGSWVDGNLCFDAAASGPVAITVTATNDDGCGETVCVVDVDVTVNDLPTITCPTVPIQKTVCSAGLICVELPIDGAVTVDGGGASWSDGLLCFDAPASDLYTFEVSATNDCGTVTCTVEVDVVVEGLPIITCPTEPVPIFLCEAGLVCFEVPIEGAIAVSTSLGSFVGSDICFQADTSGTYSIHVEASNSCGVEACDLSVVVVIGAAPVITCPGTLSDSLEYPGTVCQALEISGASSVTIDGATYENGDICFQADTSGTYVFEVIASSDCGADTCTVTIAVDITPPCVDIMLSDTAISFTAFAGDVTPDPESYTIKIMSSVDTIPFDFTITGMEDWMTVTPTSGNTGETGLDVVISGDVSSLPLNLSQVNLTISSTSDRVCEPKMTTLQVNVNIFKVPSADTVLVGNLPAVPGMQVAVPITFANSCFLSGAQIDLAWGTTEIFLDSVSYEGSVFSEFGLTEIIDNDASTVFLRADIFGADEISPSAGELNLWANLHFTVSCNVEPGTYALGANIEPLQFDRDCGEGIETDSPEFVGGNVLVDASGNYYCGWAVTNGVGNPAVEGATVEMWSSYPLGELLMSTTSGHNGAFAFENFPASVFDLYVYGQGYYPTTSFNVGFGERGEKIILAPLADFVKTDKWNRYYCDANTLLGAPLPVGSVVEAYVGALLCGRQTVIEPGIYNFMMVYRDDSFTPEIDGANTGDIISFYVNGAEALATGDVIFPEFDFDPPIYVCLAAGTKLTKTCDLMGGSWNLISWNLNTESDHVEDLLADHMDCIDVVLGFENGGLAYDPDLPQFSTLWAMDHLSGYWVKVKPDCGFTLELEGLPVLAGTPIVVNRGWNLVSYLADGPLAPEVALASIHDDLILAYGSPDGIKLYIPGEGTFNTLEEMSTCLGYWLKVSADGVLNYPSNGPIPPLDEIDPLIAEAARLAPQDVAPTTSWVNLYATDLTLDGEKVQAGAEIAAYSTAGNKIGSFIMSSTGSFGFMPVYADGAGSERVTGLNPGQKFSLTINNVEVVETFTWTQSGDRIEIVTLTSKGTVETQLPNAYTLGQNYPNPFNPSTTITFNLPATAMAKIEIFNVLGKLVAVPFNGMANAGDNSTVWNGRLTNGQTASSGVYFYRLTSAGHSETRKMMLLK